VAKKGKSSSVTKREVWFGEQVAKAVFGGKGEAGHFVTTITDEDGNKHTGVGRTSEESEAKASEKASR